MISNDDFTLSGISTRSFSFSSGISTVLIPPLSAAALRGGIKTVLIPEENEKDLVDIPDNVKSSLEIIAVKNVSEVLKIALTSTPDPIEWDEAAEEAAAANAVKEQNESRTTKH